MTPTKSALKHLIPPLVCVLAASIFFVQTSALLELERDIADARYTLQQIELRDAVIAITEQQEQLDRLTSQTEQLRRDLTEATTFEPRDIPLTADLQLHTYRVGRKYGVPADILLAIMAHESGYQPAAVGYNQNGTTDLGLCQINSVNHAWLLADHGLDVADPRDNIEAAALILSIYIRKYPMDQALAAYAAGESGMLAGGGAWFAEEILLIMKGTDSHDKSFL